MAPSDRRILISLLVAFAVAVPSLHPSAATGVEGSAEAAAAAAPSPHGEVLQPAGFNIPDLPLPRILPCPPWFPKIPLIPCFNVTPPPPPTTDPRECRSSLWSLMMPCAGFLTNASVPAPPSTCCDGFDPFFANQSSSPSALLCLCHIASADIARLLPAPMNHTRAASVMEACGLGLPIDALSRFCKTNRDQVPQIDPPSPPSAAPGTKV